MKTPNVDDAIVKSIASDTNVPVEMVLRMYEETWAEYSDGARIVDYLPVLVARRVRDNLRHWGQEIH
ncbi:DUF3562 domain-containing protein [Paraburkholderia dinghuensis]|uniref:DUF3562 domain-containing protein n=1 Tax=Paraburkholderia dinghuensis TaxID=2305225 RepID=A0A3N6Q1P5_9BURK|nr:DUF3562 domain-containing protein [Paraburkholderia dinghuensis]RQH06156.1 DUF3562 domain-containing protein [Paraburkholderia dinghuensis]